MKIVLQEEIVVVVGRRILATFEPFAGCPSEREIRTKAGLPSTAKGASRSGKPGGWRIWLDAVLGRSGGTGA